MMLVRSLKKPRDRSIGIFVRAEPILKIDAERSLRGRQALFGGKPHQSKRGVHVLIVIPFAAPALFFKLLPESELTEGITQFGCRSAEPCGIQFTAPEPCEADFFDPRPQHQRAWLPLIFLCIKQPFLPGDNIPIRFSRSSRCIPRSQ